MSHQKASNKNSDQQEYDYFGIQINRLQKLLELIKIVDCDQVIAQQNSIQTEYQGFGQKMTVKQ